MAWVKLDDSKPTHPKVMAAGVDGYALDVAGICYTNRLGLEGHIPSTGLRDVLPNLSHPARAAAALVGAGLWEEVPDGWRILGYEVRWVRFVGDNRAPRWVRRLIFDRDGRVCRSCGSTKDLQIDHVVPKARGGTHDPSNLQVLCGPCNRAKGTSVPEGGV